LAYARMLLAYILAVQSVTGGYDPEDNALGVGQEAVDLMRLVGDRWGGACALTANGAVVGVLRSPTEGEALCRQALGEFRVMGDRLQAANALLWLNILAQVRNDPDAARQFAEECVEIYRQSGHVLATVSMEKLLAQITQHAGDVERAALEYGRALVTGQRVGAARDIIQCLHGLAWAASERGRHRRAARLFGVAEALSQTSGVSHPRPFDPLIYDRVVASVRGALGEDAFEDAWAEGLWIPVEEGCEEALEEARENFQNAVMA
jgi:hypothetical protein